MAPLVQDVIENIDDPVFVDGERRDAVHHHRRLAHVRADGDRRARGVQHGVVADMDFGVVLEEIDVRRTGEGRRLIGFRLHADGAARDEIHPGLRGEPLESIGLNGLTPFVEF